MTNSISSLIKPGLLFCAMAAMSIVHAAPLCDDRYRTTVNGHAMYYLGTRTGIIVAAIAWRWSNRIALSFLDRN